MTADRPMSAHEGALFESVQVLAKTLLDLGADASVLRARLTEARDATGSLGNRAGAGTLDFLIDSLFSPRDPPPKPSLRIV
jgi:hypothetical protein